MSPYFRLQVVEASSQPPGTCTAQPLPTGFISADRHCSSPLARTGAASADVVATTAPLMAITAVAPTVTAVRRNLMVFPSSLRSPHRDRLLVETEQAVLL